MHTKVISKVLNVLAMTMFLAAGVHLIIIFTMAVTHQQMHFINPLYLFGLNYVFPGLLNSNIVVLVGWLAVGLLYLMVMSFSLYYRVRMVVRYRVPAQRRQREHTDIRRTVDKQLAGILSLEALDD